MLRMLGLTVEELQELFESRKKTYRDYKNKRWMIISVLMFCVCSA